jgi:serine/threonine protein kinase
MAMDPAANAFPPRLPPGTLVGRWLLVEWQGHGAFGGVYRALRTGQEHSGPVALKLSVYPWDARFAREVQVLSRLQHPAVPRLLDHGVLRLPSGAEHPYLVMDWIEGLPLYSWAELHSPSSPQLFRLLAQLARALAATHAALAVHRDVKGDNILVRLSDGQPFLIDFGSAHFQGASRLTWQSLHPFTPAYLSPAAWLALINSEHSPDSHYQATPADDLYALGVTAYHLLMGKHPGGSYRIGVSNFAEVDEEVVGAINVIDNFAIHPILNDAVIDHYIRVAGGRWFVEIFIWNIAFHRENCDSVDDCHPVPALIASKYSIGVIGGRRAYKAGQRIISGRAVGTLRSLHQDRCRHAGVGGRDE